MAEVPDLTNLTGTKLYEALTRAFGGVMKDGKVDTIEVAKAAKMIAPVYDRIFGTGMVSNHLKDDLVGHADGTIKAALKKPVEYKNVEDFIRLHVEEYGIDGLRADWHSGVNELLWTKRALDFITTFLEKGILTMADKTLYDCAHSAYTTILKPYHGFMVSSVVSLAFNLCPSRELFLKYLGFDSLPHAQECLQVFLAASRPVIVLLDTLLNKYGCNFPDKA